MSRKLAAEVLGTFVLVLFGCGAAMASGADITTTSLAFGISVLVMAYAVGHISGGHFNPAVSVGAAVAGRIAWVEVVFYVAAQLVGALLAGLALFITYKGFDGFEAEGNMAQNGFGDDGSGLALWAALLIEVIGTAVFLWVILAATDKRNKTILGAAPLAIGATLAGLHMVMIPLTGTSVNPARSIGVGVFAGTDAIVQLWVFIVAPLLGAALAGITYAFIFGNDGMAVPGSGFASGASAPAGGWAPGQGQWAPGPQGQQWAPQQPHQVNPNPGAPGGPGGAPSTPGGPQPGQWGQQPPAPQPGSPQPGQQPPGQWAPPAGGPGQQPGQQPGQWGPPPQPPNG